MAANLLSTECLTVDDCRHSSHSGHYFSHHFGTQVYWRLLEPYEEYSLNLCLQCTNVPSFNVNDMVSALWSLRRILIECFPFDRLAISIECGSLPVKTETYGIGLPTPSIPYHAPSFLYGNSSLQGLGSSPSIAQVTFVKETDALHAAVSVCPCTELLQTK